MNLLEVYLIVLISVASGIAEDFDGRVLAVNEGDTLTVERAGERLTIRVSDIDAPELGQPYGPEALAFTRRLVLGKAVRVQLAPLLDGGAIRRGRVTLANGSSLSHELLRAGLAWWDRTTTPNDDSLWKLEREARIEQRGLWTDADPIPPWEWRKGF